MATQQPARPSRLQARHWWWIAAAVVVVTLSVVLVVVNVAAQTAAPTSSTATQPAAATPTGTPSGTSTPGPSDPATPGTEAAQPPEAEPAPPAALPPVALTESVAPVPGVSFSIDSIEAVEGAARGPGEVGGPAVRFALRVHNETNAAVSLKSTVVNLYAGEELAPAVDLNEPGGVPLPDEVAAGATANAVFIFTVPVEQRAHMQIAVDYSVGAPIVLFEGAAPR